MQQLILKTNTKIPQNLPIVDICETYQNPKTESKNIIVKNQDSESFHTDNTVTENAFDETKPVLPEKTDTSLTTNFKPKAFVCFKDDTKETYTGFGVTFAQEAQKYKKSTPKISDVFIQPAQHEKKRTVLKIHTLQEKKPIPVINTSICGSRFISDTASLLDYCMKWCKSVYFGRVILRAIHNTGTLLLIFPGKAHHFIQFVHGKSSLTEAQRQFQNQIEKTDDVIVFHSFQNFSDWMKKQFLCQA
ncbi:MAG: hypothetical protein IJC11_02150 [Alphaproteobacteria bacterium]|nr:hypothetical protein [Alphaproteobacteria bacterium]MBQ6855114.1 hypothetical protein [Alphaproteobacteria bacterium]